MREKLREYIAAHRSDMLADLANLVEVPSVAKPGADGLPYGKDCREVLARAEELARRLGFVTQVRDDARIILITNPNRLAKAQTLIVRDLPIRCI